MREAEVNGDAAPLLFLQPVGIDSGQRLDQRGFAVVDVPGRSYNDGFHLGRSILPETGVNRCYATEQSRHAEFAIPQLQRSRHKLALP